MADTPCPPSISSLDDGSVDGTPSPSSQCLGGNKSVPSLEQFLRGILCENLKKSEDYLTSVMNSFEEQDVSSVELLVTLFSNSSHVETFKPTIVVDGRAARGVELR